MIELILFAIAIFGIGGVIVMASVNRGQKRSEANAEQILNNAFNGKEHVTFTINMQSVKYETVVIGAKKRGYKLIHQADGKYGPEKLIFEKV